jgi:hypothetical protein
MTSKRVLIRDAIICALCGIFGLWIVLMTTEPPIPILADPVENQWLQEAMKGLREDWWKSVGPTVIMLWACISVSFGISTALFVAAWRYPRNTAPTSDLS